MELGSVCDKGDRWFRQPIPPTFDHQVDGRSTGLANAVQQAAVLLAGSNAPLIVGLDHLTTQAQQSAWRLAKQLRATIDTTLGDNHRAHMFALQRVGKVTATLGEVSTRSDVVVFWFCDPATTHPRHLERYSRPANRRKRTVIVVDEKPTKTSAQADILIELPRSAAGAALSVFRAVLAGIELDDSAVKAQTGTPVDRWKDFVEQMVAAKYGSIFHGQTTAESSFDTAMDSLALFVRDLNDTTCFVSIGMRNDGNALGGENVLAWSSGFPFAVNLARQYPRFHWLEYSAASILRRGECDCILVATDDSLGQALDALDDTAKEHFDRTPKILVASQDYQGLANVAVGFRVPPPGIHVNGDLCRQDDVALPLTSVPQPERAATAREILDEIRTAIGSGMAIGSD